MASGVRSNHFAQISAALPEILSKIIRKTAFDLQAEAQVRAPVDTGFLENSIYVSTYEDSDYGKGGFFGQGSAELLDEVERPMDPYTARVAVGANYGIYVEMGTVNQAPQPYFHPAIDYVRPEFEAALSTVERQLRQAAR